MIQIITYNKTKFQNFSENYKISNLDEFDSFDDYNITIIDLSNENIWYYNNDSTSSLNNISDFQTLKKEIETSKHCKIIIVLPQNCYFYYDYYWYNKQYQKSIKLKDILSSFISLLSKNLFKIEGFDISYSKNTTLIGNCSYKSDFNFNEIISNSFSVITKSKCSDKTTSIVYENLIITSLNIFETPQHLMEFINPLLIDNNTETIIPDWFNNINFFDDKTLKNNKIENIKKIELIREKNKEIDKKLEKNNKIKSILYTTGDELVKNVMEILDTILENDSSDFIDEKKEDFLIKKEAVTFVGEIKGVSSSVANKNISQLDVHVQSYLDKITEQGLKENVKGLLIINHQRNKNINERNEVHQNQIDLATRNGALIIESTILLSLYEKFLENKISSQKIVYLLSDKVGILLKKDITKEDILD